MLNKINPTGNFLLKICFITQKNCVHSPIIDQWVYPFKHFFCYNYYVSVFCIVIAYVTTRKSWMMNICFMGVFTTTFTPALQGLTNTTDSFIGLGIFQCYCSSLYWKSMKYGTTFSAHPSYHAALGYSFVDVLWNSPCDEHDQI